ncbi:DUF2164 domain-containing protein [Leucothrix pacifica]|uniref:DUF2164 domain-containing protein n=1 Tax=Leucothrix pacifica TaxID=1247513 RepID=A0A317C7Q0_9GAMM|nr:DUF2164 domain-containing protein [Leucothrix pacifica]PWQ92340.1 DUF2164 domain-containing protein [Leucothrix pacifica]
MADIEFSAEEKSVIVDKIQRYFDEELGQEIGGFDAEFLLDFFSHEVGAYYYNQGLNDAKGLIEERLTSLTDAIYEIEKPTTFAR